MVENIKYYNTSLCRNNTSVSCISAEVTFDTKIPLQYYRKHVETWLNATYTHPTGKRCFFNLLLHVRLLNVHNRYYYLHKVTHWICLDSHLCGTQLTCKSWIHRLNTDQRYSRKNTRVIYVEILLSVCTITQPLRSRKYSSRSLGCC